MNAYEDDRAELMTARATVERLTKPVLTQAIERGETWTAEISYYGTTVTIQHFLTKEDVSNLINGDCYVHWVKDPSGSDVDKFSL